MKQHQPPDAYRASRGWHIVEAALEYFISILISGAYLARLTGALGFSDSLTGILGSIASLGCVLQLGGIVLFGKRTSVKRPIIFCHIINDGLFALLYLIPLFPMSPGLKAGIFVFGFCFSYMLLNIIRSQKTAWTLSLLDERTRGVYTAKVEIVSLIGGMAFTYAMGSMIDGLEARGDSRGALILGAATILALTVFHIISLTLVKEKPAAGDGAPGGLRSVRPLLKNKMLRRIVLVGMLWHAAVYSSTPYYGPYQIKELGFSMTFISVLGIVGSVVRAAFSPVMGRYADRRSFSHMIYVCFLAAAASFLVNCFTVPENGAVMSMIHTVIYSVSMAGANNAMVNLVLDYVQPADRRTALPIHMALSGGAGFLGACLMSPLVALIQENGNRLLGISLYPAQFVSAVALTITLFLLFFVRLGVIGASKKDLTDTPISGITEG